MQLISKLKKKKRFGTKKYYLKIFECRRTQSKNIFIYILLDFIYEFNMTHKFLTKNNTDFTKLYKKQ